MPFSIAKFFHTPACDALQKVLVECIFLQLNVEQFYRIEILWKLVATGHTDGILNECIWVECFACSRGYFLRSTSRDKKCMMLFCCVHIRTYLQHAKSRHTGELCSCWFEPIEKSAYCVWMPPCETWKTRFLFSLRFHSQSHVHDDGEIYE